MLYDQGLPEIQDLTDLQNEIKSSSIDSEWCPSSVKIESLVQENENVYSWSWRLSVLKTILLIKMLLKSFQLTRELIGRKVI